MIRVGLSGGIGAGKSTVARTFTDLGARLVDSDVIAREVVAPGTTGLEQLVAAFGSDILADDGSLDRPALAAKAFADDEQRLKLNAITHPLVAARTWELVGSAPHDAIVVQDIPLLVENGMAPWFHLVVIVHADEKVRVDRLTNHRGMASDDARARIRAQATVEERRAAADVWLDNSGAPEAVVAAARSLWTDRLVPFERNVRSHTPAETTGVVDGDHAARARLLARLRALCGEQAEHVDVDQGSGDALVSVTDDAAAAALSETLSDGGFPARPHTDGGDVRTLSSADPGRPATVHLRAAS
ncbi:dephospho-CoA kinase [Williamsia sterculiae]|uniref:Dephospho-CoA kinase n=1 Tax=Williamsia sterculiae TaxID=1344003 RepID=A0A1N7HG13_9NOCA|nr:dephospho-CoA kinase [Williamsia sterculiae]SIS23834.1 dephospho-CoA kinase [Williamsia sterculiae]